MQVVRKNVLEVLKKLSPVIKTKKKDNESGYFVFTASYVCCMDDKCFMLYDQPVLNFECAVRGLELYTVLNRMKDEVVNITLLESALLVQGENIEANIALFSKMTTPVKEVKENINSCRKYPFPNNITELWKHLAKYAVNATNAPELNGVHVTNNYVEAREQIRVCRSLPKTEQQNDDYVVIPLFGNEETIDFCLPKQSIDIIESFNPQYMSVGQDWIHLFDGFYSCSIRKVITKFPDITSFLQAFDGDTIEYKLEKPVYEAINTLMVMSKTGEGIHTQYLKCKIHDNNVTLSCKGTHGVYKETIEQDNEGVPDIEFKFSISVFKDILSHTDTLICTKPFIDEDITIPKKCLVKYVYDDVEHIVCPEIF